MQQAKVAVDFKYSELNTELPDLHDLAAQVAALSQAAAGTAPDADP